MPIRVLRGHVETVAPTVPTKGMSVTWKRYLVAALNAFISGSAGSLSSFTAASLLGVNAMTAVKLAGLTALGSGVVSFAKYMAQNPLPGAE